MADGNLSRNAVQEYKRFIQKAAHHYKKAEWEDMGKALEQAKECCDESSFPDRTRCKQQVFEQYGSLMRRYGQYHKAAIILAKALMLDQEDKEETFEELLAEADQNSQAVLSNIEGVAQSSTLERLTILGELGTVYRHMGASKNAATAFDLQYRQADRLIWKAEAEACRAVGNAGMVKYEAFVSNTDGRREVTLLDEAIQNLEERVSRAQALKSNLAGYEDDEAQMLSKKAHQWQCIGVVRLVLCYIAKNEPERALGYGKQGTEICQDLTDPTMRAHGRFYHGYALWHSGQKEEAERLFSYWSETDDRDKCTPAIALCKEPSQEYRGYLRLMVEAGIDMSHVDEQGYSALDYAIFAGDEDAASIVSSSLNVSAEEVERLRYQATLRKYYRLVLQNHFRPVFSAEGDLIAAAREKYAQLLDNDTDLAQHFDRLKYVDYAAFKAHGRLPRFDDGGGIVKNYQRGRTSNDLVVVFMSYRWIGSPGKPDDQRNTQYQRMCDALEQLIGKEGIAGDRLGVWLDIACIDQTNKDPGVATLPLVVVQCNYMLSLVDTKGDWQYYDRAWCCLEALLIGTVERSYRRHRRYEHVFLTARKGKLQAAVTLGGSRPSEQGLSNANDKPHIQFLERQTRLLDKSA